jgi:hypothetical protein
MPEEAQIMKNGKGAFSRLLSWVAWVFLAFVFYVLSYGPALKLARRDLLPDKAEIVYGPLVALFHRSSAAEKVLEWYAENIWQTTMPHSCRLESVPLDPKPAREVD